MFERNTFLFTFWFTFRLFAVVFENNKTLYNVHTQLHNDEDKILMELIRKSEQNVQNVCVKNDRAVWYFGKIWSRVFILKCVQFCRCHKTNISTHECVKCWKNTNESGQTIVEFKQLSPVKEATMVNFTIILDGQILFEMIRTLLKTEKGQF